MAPKSPKMLLVEWANAQDQWVRSIVTDVLASRQPLGEEDVGQAYEHLLVEKELGQGEGVNVPLLMATSTDREKVETLELVRLGDLCGVNALCGTQEIVFNPRLTVLFGENAAGKSGYVRVLKRIAAVRSQEEVLPNLLAATPAPTQKAAIRYRLDGHEADYGWTGQSGVLPFTRMTVFDSRAVAVHLDADLTYSYTPRDLSLFRISHEAIESVRAKLDGARAVALPKGNPYLPLFARGSSVYSKIETLGAQTDIGDLEKLATVADCEAAELPELRSRVDALKSEAGQLRLEVAKGDLDLFRRVMKVSTELEAVEWSKYGGVLGRVQAATKQYDDATVNAFHGLAIPAMLSDAWRRFIEAGEVYIQSTQPERYPTEGEACVFCRQPLQAAAVDLVGRYRDFCNNKLKKNLTDAQAARDAFTRTVLELAVPSVQMDVRRRLEPMEPTAVPPLLRQSLALMEYAAAVQGQYTRGEDVTATDAERVQQLAAMVTSVVRESIRQADELVTDLTGASADRATTLIDLSKRIADIEARNKLCDVITGVKEHVANAKWAAGAEKVSGRFTALLRSLTEAAKSASQELLNQDFERLFEDERKALRAPHVRLEFPGRDAQPKRRKRLAKHTLSEVLSEGEQKVIALADFLAEAAMPQTVAPVIFDDPVTSLDYKRLHHVVERIVQLSAERQVVVFTHNIWFTAELLNRFEKNPAAISYFEISNEDNAPGKVEALKHPKWDTPNRIAKEIEERIRAAEKLTGTVREDVVRAAYSQIRSWCEAFVERDLLADVTARYRPHVRMTSLPQIKADRLDDAVNAVLPVFEKACRVTTAHSQPLETLGVRPKLEELKGDWKILTDAQSKYKA